MLLPNEEPVRNLPPGTLFTTAQGDMGIVTIEQGHRRYVSESGEEMEVNDATLVLSASNPT